MKKLSITIIIISSFFTLGSAQNIDYLEVRDSLTRFSCGANNLTDIKKTKENLESLDTTLISANIQEYYYDLGFCNYLYYSYEKNEILIILAISSFKKVLFHDEENESAIWNLIVIYNFLEDYPNCLKYITAYYNLESKDYSVIEEIKAIEKDCKEKI